MKNELRPYGGLTEQGNEEDRDRGVQVRLLELLAKRTQRYTMGDSSSVPVETAQELFHSLCFTLGFDLNEPLGKRALLEEEDMEEAFVRGISRIEARIEAGKSLWQRACMTAPPIENYALRDTLRSIGGFFARYDYRFFAHLIPCDIDYLLCHPISEQHLGIEYINAYLCHLNIEQAFLRHFDARRCIRLLDAYCRDYKGLLINLYEPVATNVIGCAILEESIYTLDISKGQCGRLEALFAGLSRLEAVRTLAQAATEALDQLDVKEPQARQYLLDLAKALYPRIHRAEEGGTLSGIFLSLS